MRKAALAIDSNTPSFFKEADRQALAICLKEFGVRLKLEFGLLVLTEKGGFHADPSQP